MFSIRVKCEKLIDFFRSCTKRRGGECSRLIHSFDKQVEETDSRQDVSMRYLNENKRHISIKVWIT